MHQAAGLKPKPEATHASLIESLADAMRALRAKRDKLSARVQREEEERQKLRMTLDQLAANLLEREESIEKQSRQRDEWDKKLSEAEEAYSKILESAQTLAHVLRQEAAI
eukprot:Polyplicarium_translucidae@DN2874_c0_g1_i2.p4